MQASMQGVEKRRRVKGVLCVSGSTRLAPEGLVHEGKRKTSGCEEEAQSQNQQDRGYTEAVLINRAG